MFWKTLNPFLLDKGTNVSKITFVSNEKVISDVSNLRQFLAIWKDAAKALFTKVDVEKTVCLESNNPVEIAIRKCNGHSIITKIKQTINISSVFHFSIVEAADVEKELKSLNGFKVETFQNKPTKCYKEFSNVCSSTLSRLWNEALVLKKYFPQKSEVMLMDITPAHERKKIQHRREVTDQLVFCQHFKEYLNSWCKNK